VAPEAGNRHAHAGWGYEPTARAGLSRVALTERHASTPTKPKSPIVAASTMPPFDSTVVEEQTPPFRK